MILAMLIESDEEEPRGTAPAESSMAVQQSAMVHLNAIHTHSRRPRSIPPAMHGYIKNHANRIA